MVGALVALAGVIHLEIAQGAGAVRVQNRLLGACTCFLIPGALLVFVGAALKQVT